MNDHAKGRMISELCAGGGHQRAREEKTMPVGRNRLPKADLEAGRWDQGQLTTEERAIDHEVFYNLIV